VKATVIKYIREQRLLRAGDRVAVAVSGGPDSVALLRVLLELREELGIVLFVAHFHHGIRGAEADADRDFVSALARDNGLEFFCGEGSAPELVRRRSLTLEEAARELRYAFFARLAQEQRLQRIATGHSRDDQAETVLMKFIRGTGSRGLSGIFPQHELAGSEACVVRPLLCVRRNEIEQYLRQLSQRWREDATNQDLHHTRNRVRSRLLPLLEQEFNQAVVETLSNTAEVARAEEEYWAAEMRRILPLLLLPGKPVRGGGRAVETAGEKSAGLDLDALRRHPLALQRRILRAAAEQIGIHLDFEHVLAVERLLEPDHPSTKQVEFPGGYIAHRGYRELRFERARALPGKKFAYELSVPGAQSIPELGTTICTSLGNRTLPSEEYNQPHSIRLNRYETTFSVRPWRAGDRFQPAHAGSEKKLKELLQPLHLPQEQRAIWPVITAGARIIWVRGFPSPPITFEGAGEEHLLLIEEVPVVGGQSSGGQSQPSGVDYIL
jgi:tRNA(Ile)-lysidine synthase